MPLKITITTVAQTISNLSSGGRFGFANLPAIATHLACFLVGTLLFEPDTKGKVPFDFLVPWPVQKIEGEVLVAREYQLVSRKENCVLLPTGFRLFQPEAKKVFVVVPKVKDWLEVSGRWQKEDARLLRKDLVREPPCSKMRSNVEIFG